MITLDAANHNGTATYSPNFPGARTLREARSFHINGENVTGHVYNHQGAQWITVHVGCRTAFEGPVPADVTRDNVHTWIVDTATAWAARQDAEQTAKFEAILTAEDEFKTAKIMAGLGMTPADRTRGMQQMPKRMAALSALMDTLTPMEMRAYGAYRKTALGY